MKSSRPKDEWPLDESYPNIVLFDAILQKREEGPPNKPESEEGDWQETAPGDVELDQT